MLPSPLMSYFSSVSGFGVGVGFGFAVPSSVRFMPVTASSSASTIVALLFDDCVPLLL
ncbi:MAG: hypothetical protein GX383_03455 [Clostridium sp.]|jgi:hypothetical protein|nr:hypothetical protein [Clostridium sp.]